MAPVVTVHRLTEQHAGREVQAQWDDDLHVELVENASAGYAWTLRTEPPDAVDVHHSEFVPPTSDAAGAAGLRRFHLRPKRSGRVRVVLELRPQYAPSMPPERTAAFHVITSR